MAVLYIDRSGTVLTVERAALIVREPESKPRSLPIQQIERLVVSGDIRISATVLTRLGELDCSVSFLPGRGRAQAVHLAGQTHGDIHRRIAQYQLSIDPDARATWVRRILHLRISGQRRLLTEGLRLRPDQRRVLTPAIARLQEAIRQVHGAGRDIEQLRGCEGAATREFFRGYRAILPESVGFDGRNRRPPRDPVNATLSLGYTLSHGDALKAVHRAGLDPALGLLHEPLYGRDSLVCDLNELARARVEWLVWRLFADQELRAEDFSRQQDGAMLLGKAGRQRFYAGYEQHAAVHRRLLRQAVSYYARALGRSNEEPAHG